jgi:hypothetical protein
MGREDVKGRWEERMGKGRREEKMGKRLDRKRGRQMGGAGEKVGDAEEKMERGRREERARDRVYESGKGRWEE